MKFIADLHIHSYLSRATSRRSTPEYLNYWAQLKGIKVVGTGDFTHPKWLAELKEKLEPAKDGLYRLKDEFAMNMKEEIPHSCLSDVQFILQCEISTIYKKGDMTRKIHHVIFMPDIQGAEELSNRLRRIGNITSDGRPILGLDSRDLLEIVLEVSEDAFLVPAHIWTPWFSLFGSKSGFDTIEECYEDLSEHIFALETGLSSDPPMNWRLSALDRYTLISNSDAHSPANLARESNLFDTDLSYHAIRDSLRYRKGFLGTIEFFPQEGKYHYDGHRKCQTRMSPNETLANKGICPVCGKEVTIGVMHRVESLADRPEGGRPEKIDPFSSLISLRSIIGEILQVGPDSAKVQKRYFQILSEFGPELAILKDIPLDQVKKGDPLLVEALRRMRSCNIHILEGYDGEFGKIQIFDERELTELSGQLSILPYSKTTKRSKSGKRDIKTSHLDKEDISRSSCSDCLNTLNRSKELNDSNSLNGLNGLNGSNGLLRCDNHITDDPEDITNDIEYLMKGLNSRQREVAEAETGPLIVVAGPGTGKTRTLTCRIAYHVLKRLVMPEHILGVTFTNKAAQEMVERITLLLRHRDKVKEMTISTFHALCLNILKNEAKGIGISPEFKIFNDEDSLELLTSLEIVGLSDTSHTSLEKILSDISKAKQNLLSPDDLTISDERFASIYHSYEEGLLCQGGLDLDDLIFKTVKLFEDYPDICQRYKERFLSISVDEYQDINFAQYRLIRILAGDGRGLCVIGDPNQAIYGFRGSDVTYFQSFEEDYPNARVFILNENYRSSETILKASEQVILMNPHAVRSQLHAVIEKGPKIQIYKTATDKAEAEFCVHTIEKFIGGTSYFSIDSARVGDEDGIIPMSFSDFAILYRLRREGDLFEEAFLRSGMPYQRVDAPIWAKKKIFCTIFSYLRVLSDRSSDIDILRILRHPYYKIDSKTINILNRSCREKGLPLSKGISMTELINDLSPSERGRLKGIAGSIHDLIHQGKDIPLPQQISMILTKIGVPGILEGSEGLGEEDKTYLPIIEMVRSFNGTTKEFLDRITMNVETDQLIPQGDKISLMTLHASKGLEFEVVFITGCEDGLIPYCRGEKEAGHREDEERRLFYVGMTRAKARLYLTHASRRTLFGQVMENPPSPYLSDIKQILLEYESQSFRPMKKKEEDRQMILF
ncbi:MAG: UvrD-helicase domain-containing protein [Nitrospinae bacterium]|nr:UvrD-helicase domain-containing protein [Nitrospinota bacterium]